MLNATDVSKNKVNTADQLEGTFHEAGGFLPAMGVRKSLLEKEGKWSKEGVTQAAGVAAEIICI